MPILGNFPAGGGGSGTGGLALAAVSDIATVTASGKVYVKWTDPDDLVVAGSTLAAWGGTLLVRKAGSAPVSRRDGTVVLDSKTRNQYSSTYFCDSGLTDGVTYYYKFFPYTTSNAYTDSTDNEFNKTPNPVPLGNISSASAVASGNSKLDVKWTDPAATVVSDGVTLATWQKTVVVAKVGSAPTGPDDPDAAKSQVVTTRNAYAASPLTLTELTNGTTYYIGIFPVSTDGAANTAAANVITGVPNRKKITVAPAQSGTLTYTGSAQSPSWSGYDTAKMTLGGQTAETDAGDYTAQFTPKDDYCWSDGSIEPKDVAWTIGRASISKVPSQSGTLTYTGTTQSPAWSNFNAAQLTIGGTTSAVDAGSYNASFTPTGNYQWSDGSVAEKSVAWIIDVKTLVVPTATTLAFTYDGNPHGPNVSGYDSGTMRQTGNALATVAGNYTVTYDLKDKSNYQWADGTTTSKSISWGINRAKLPIPTASGTTFTYNGSSQAPTVTGYDGNTMNQGGVASSVNAGSFTITYSLKDAANYEWSDGTQGDKTISWKINKAAGSMSLDQTSMELNVNALTKNIVVTRVGDGAISASSSNTDVATVSVSGTTVTVTAKLSGKATISIGVAAGTNHTAPSSKTCAVTITLPGATLSSETPATIQAAARAGTAPSLWHVGDKIGIRLSGTVVSQSFSGTYYAFIIGFNHNSTIEGNNTIHFQFGKTSDGKDIAFVDDAFAYAKDDAYMGSKVKFVMNTSRTNSGGWKSSYMRSTICPAFLNCMPSAWRNVITACTKYTDNTGGNTNPPSASSVTSTSDKIWLLSEFEMCGYINYSNAAEENYQKQYTYYANGNGQKIYPNKNSDSVSTTDTISIHARSPYCDSSGDAFVFMSSPHYPSAMRADVSRGFAPCFMVA